MKRSKPFHSREHKHQSLHPVMSSWMLGTES